MGFSQAGREAQLAGLANALEGGALCLYDGTQPGSPDAEVRGDSSLLAELPVVEGSLDVRDGWLRYSVNGVGAVLGTATWFRLKRRDGAPLEDGSVGRTEGDLVLPLNLVQPGAPITITAAITVPAGAD